MMRLLPFLLSAVLTAAAEARSYPARDELKSLQSSLEMFRIHTGRYPSGEEGLKALVERPVRWPDSAHWEKCLDAVPRDPWKNPYGYVEGSGFSRKGGYGHGLYSMGPDGKSATQGNDPDDINTWSDPDKAPSPLVSMLRRDLPVLAVTFLLGVAAASFFRRARSLPPDAA